MINNTIGNKRLAKMILKSLQNGNLGGRYGLTATTKECTTKHRLAYGQALTSAAWTILLTCMNTMLMKNKPVKVSPTIQTAYYKMGFINFLVYDNGHAAISILEIYELCGKKADK